MKEITPPTRPAPSPRPTTEAQEIRVEHKHLAPGDVVSVIDYTPGHMGGLELRRVTLVQHQSGRLWLVDADGKQVERKIDSVANVVGGPKLAAARSG